MQRKQSIKMTEWEKSNFENIISRSGEAARVEETYKKEYPLISNLQTDLLASLYKGSAELVPQNEMAYSHQLNWSIISNAMESPEYRSLHVRTKRDEDAALLASLIMADKILVNVDKETMNAFKELEEIEKELAYYKELANLAQEVGDKKNENEFKERLKHTEEKMNQYKEKINLDGVQSAVLDVVNRAAAEAKRELQGIDSISVSYGLHEGDGARMSASARFELAKQINNKYNLRMISDWLGRLRRIARSVKKKEKVPEEVVSVVAGKDLPRVLPSEYALLNTPLQDLFYQRYAEEQLLQFNMEKPAQDAKGPFIISVDTSGSMSGGRDAFAKALAIAFLEIGRKEKRDVWVTVFSGPKEHQTFHLPHQNHDPRTVIEIAEMFYGGGTDFVGPLKEAMGIIGQREAKADLLFLSDGDGYVTEETANEFNELRRKHNSRTFGVVIGGTGTRMKLFCDKVIHHAHLGDDLAREIYEWAIL